MSLFLRTNPFTLPFVWELEFFTNCEQPFLEINLRKYIKIAFFFFPYDEIANIKILLIQNQNYFFKYFWAWPKAQKKYIKINGKKTHLDKFFHFKKTCQNCVMQKHSIANLLNKLTWRNKVFVAIRFLSAFSFCSLPALKRPQHSNLVAIGTTTIPCFHYVCLTFLWSNSR